MRDLMSKFVMLRACETKTINVTNVTTSVACPLKLLPVVIEVLNHPQMVYKPLRILICC